MIHQKGITPLWCWTTSYKHHLFRITMAVSYKISCYPINTICLWCWITSINQMQISRVGLTTRYKPPVWKFHHLEPHDIPMTETPPPPPGRPTSNDMALVFELIEGPTLHETRPPQHLVEIRFNSKENDGGFTWRFFSKGNIGILR